MNEFIKSEDEFFYKHIMQSKLQLTNDINTEDMRFLTDDFKNGLIVSISFLILFLLFELRPFFPKNRPN